MSQAKADSALVRRLLARDEQAFRAFFDNYFPRLYRFAMARLGGDEQLSADVVQAALTKAVRNLASYRGEAALFTWLCTICRREIIDHARRQARRVEHEVLSEDPPEIRAVIESLAASEQEGPEQSYRRTELVRLIQVALDQLPVQYGDALEWKYVYGFSASEIAKRLELSTDATNSLLARAKRAFREAYGALAGGPALAAGEKS